MKTTAAHLLKSLVRQYAETGPLTSGIVDAARLGDLVDYPDVVAAARWLVAEDVAVRSSTDRLALNPLVRLHLIGPALLRQWASLDERLHDPDVDDQVVRGARQELVAVAGYAIAQGDGLDPELDLHLAQACGVLAVAGFDPECAALFEGFTGDLRHAALELFLQSATPLATRDELRDLLTGPLAAVRAVGRRRAPALRTTVRGVPADVHSGRRPVPAAPEPAAWRGTTNDAAEHLCRPNCTIDHAAEAALAAIDAAEQRMLALPAEPGWPLDEPVALDETVLDEPQYVSGVTRLGF